MVRCWCLKTMMIGGLLAAWAEVAIWDVWAEMGRMEMCWGHIIGV